MSQHTSVARASARGARAPRFGGADILPAASLWGTTGTVRTFAGGASALSIAASRIVIGGLVLLALAACAPRPRPPRRR
ncbi:Uncharacterised protein [Mycobacterium tuberculosis]|nr:Uncharacterised protein [Mycobacterium tuberculosis]